MNQPFNRLVSAVSDAETNEMPTTTIATRKATVQSACITHGKVETNCPQGGDSGHGGFARFEITDGSGADLLVTFVDREGEIFNLDDIKSIAIEVQGDHEANNLKAMLRWAANTLDNVISKNDQSRREGK
jgi:hypothetical protein